MKKRILIALFVITGLLASACTYENCSTGGAYYFTPTENCIVGVTW